MTPEQIAAWATAGESETQEFKRSTGQRREAARTVCAMLNYRGGRVLFGVEFLPDPACRQARQQAGDGRVVGQQVSDLKEVAQELREIEPPAFPTVERVALLPKLISGELRVKDAEKFIEVTA